MIWEKNLFSVPASVLELLDAGIQQSCKIFTPSKTVLAQSLVGKPLPNLVCSRKPCTPDPERWRHSCSMRSGSTAHKQQWTQGTEDSSLKFSSVISQVAGDERKPASFHFGPFHLPLSLPPGHADCWATTGHSSHPEGGGILHHMQ